jgi:hypothetical protein
MTEQVRVSGFNVPGVPAGASVVEHSREGLQPANPATAITGFMPQVPAAAPVAAPAPVAAAPAVDPTIAALLAALSGPQAAAPAAPATAAYVAPANGDPVVSSLSSILAGAGVDISRAVAKAMEYGDVSLIDKAYIASVGGANAAHLTQLAASLVEHTGREGEAAVASAHTLAGGQANWNSAAALFRQNAPAHLQTICTNMLDSGIRAQSDAAAKMVVEFAKGNGGLVQNAGLITGQATPGAEAALSKDQFQAELAKLNRNERGYEQRRGELFGRRAMGKQLGR